jgi:HD superfamily phosphohydrolase
VTLAELKGDIELFADRFVGGSFSPFSSEKIINDAVWGTQRFRPHELSVISLPIVQRLRQITQMGFVRYVYPSALHTRFEHTLGTAIVAERLFQYARKDGEAFLDEADLRHVRLAALLHDVGHCMFSHTSEDVYGHLVDEAITEEFGDENVDPKPHEFFAYLIVKTEAFGRFFRELSNHYRMSLERDVVADYIVGRATSEEHRFKVSLINGPFDADKLDYIYRDSKFSGIPLQMDLDRLFHEIRISDLSEEDDSDGQVVRDLTIGLSGVSCLEQIIFNKMLLSSLVYHHQKVKACDCMLKGVFEYLREHNLGLCFRGTEKKFDCPSDYLWFTDLDILSEGQRTPDGELHDLIHNLLYRRVLRRAAVISRKTIAKGDTLQLLRTDANRDERERAQRQLAKEIWERAGKPCSRHAVWVDMPSPPKFKEAATTFVRTDRDNTVQGHKPLTEFFPVSQWTEQYSFHKLKGHVFGPGEHVEAIAKATRDVFADRGLVLNSDAFRFCKLSGIAA